MRQIHPQTIAQSTHFLQIKCVNSWKIIAKLKSWNFSWWPTRALSTGNVFLFSINSNISIYFAFTHSNLLRVNSFLKGHQNSSNRNYVSRWRAKTRTQNWTHNKINKKEKKRKEKKNVNHINIPKKDRDWRGRERERGKEKEIECVQHTPV